MSESIRTVWDWEIGGDRYYYEMSAFDSVHAECWICPRYSKALMAVYTVVRKNVNLLTFFCDKFIGNTIGQIYQNHTKKYNRNISAYFLFELSR